jgi:PhzF family phenazine biosynthesis protein
MPTLLHVCDAFTATPFRGNPAAVCLLDAPRDEGWMQRVAGELNLSETAFLHPQDDGFSLRWFTPVSEVDLCGHATLASAHTLWETGVLHRDESVRFHTRSGILTCRRDGELTAMDFPSQPCNPCPTPKGLDSALGVPITGCHTNQTDLLVELPDDPSVRTLQPDQSFLKTLPFRGIIVTAASAHPSSDFVSRFFAPAFGIPEDPVTGSAHCALGPFWQERLNRQSLTGFQASPRGGVVLVDIHSPRVILKGQAVLASRITLLA